MKELQLLAIATFFSLLVGGGIFLVVEGDNLPGIGSNYSPGFKVLDAGAVGPTDVLTQRKNYVFREEDDYLAFWELLHGNEVGALRPPLVSFARNHVIAVVAGVQSSAGYDIAIQDIIESTDERIVEVLVSVPGEKCLVATVQTNPYEVVVVKKTDKPLRAVETIEVEEC
jgi:hypothetical protein